MRSDCASSILLFITARVVYDVSPISKPVASESQ